MEQELQVLINSPTLFEEQKNIIGNCLQKYGARGRVVAEPRLSVSTHQGEVEHKTLTIFEFLKNSCTGFLDVRRNIGLILVKFGRMLNIWRSVS